MRMSVAFLVLLWILVPGDTAAVGADSPAAGAEDGTPTATGSEVSSIPKWRLSVRTFGQSSGYPVLGVYRRIGERHDLGVAVGGRIDSRSGESDYLHVYDDGDWYGRFGDSDSDHFELSIHGELRRWSRMTDRVSCYWGARLTTGYNYDDFEELGTHEEVDDEPYDYLESRQFEEYSLGLSLTIGADLELLPHLSVSASFLPISATQTWTKRTYDTASIRNEGENRSISTNEDHALSLRFYPYAAAYLSVTF